MLVIAIFIAMVSAGGCPGSCASIAGSRVAGLPAGYFIWFKEFLDHRDPHLLGPPLRPDPQSYSALSDYTSTY